MKKLKGSIWAKIFAWILLTITAVATVLSLVAGILFYEEGVYNNNFVAKSTQDMIFNMGEEYSVKVLMDRGTGVNQKYFENTNFRYGLLKSDDISKENLNTANYIEKNFQQKISKDEVEIYHYPINTYTQFVYNDNLFGERYISDYAYNKRWLSWYVDKICYDTNSGIFYYHTIESNKYYPISRLCVSFLDCMYYYEYDKEKDEYHLESVDGNIAYEITYVEETSDEDGAVSYAVSDFDDVNQYSNFEINEIISILTDQSKMDFTKLDKTKFNNETWKNIVFDDIRQYDGDNENLYKVQISSKKDLIPEDEEYYLDNHYTLHTCKINDESEKIENYYVVVVNPTSIKADLAGDLYEKNLWLITLADKMKYGIFAIFAISLVLSLVLFIFLMSAAGYKKDPITNEIILKSSILQKIPVELEMLIAVCIIGCSGALVSETQFIDNVVIVIMLIALCTIFMAWTMIAFLTSFAIRVKMGKWWQNTILYWILMKLKKIFGNLLDGIQEIFRNSKCIWKFWVLFAGYKFLELLFVVMITDGDEQAVGAFIIVSFIEVFTFGIFTSFCLIQMQKLQDASEKIANGNLNDMIDTSKMYWDLKKHGDNLNNIGIGIGKAVDEKMKSEYFKTELITNVSHDIKTPLTSIINYVDLLGKEELHNEKATEYLEILNRQSSKLKKLIEDLVEASKASSGNMAVNMERLDLCVFLTQTVGEWSEKLEKAQLELIVTKPENPVYILADGRHLWRVVDNLLNNICKYAQQNSRVYISIDQSAGVSLIFKNISKYQLNISAEELLERFVQGDKSRNTGGHGLGLSIAQSLMTLMEGKLKLVVDGDLFKVILSFNEA